MAVFDVVCPGGHVYTALCSAAEVGIQQCPVCLVIGGERIWTAPASGRVETRTEADYDPVELDMHLEAKRYYDSPSVQKRLAEGSLKLNVRGPDFLRPKKW